MEAAITATENDAQTLTVLHKDAEKARDVLTEIKHPTLGETAIGNENDMVIFRFRRPFPSVAALRDALEKRDFTVEVNSFSLSGHIKVTKRQG